MSFINNDIELDNELDYFEEDIEEELEPIKKESLLPSLEKLITKDKNNYFVIVISENGKTAAMLINGSKKNCYTQMEGESISHALYLLECHLNKNTNKENLAKYKNKDNIDTKIIDDGTPVYITRFDDENIQLSIDTPAFNNKNTCVGNDIMECIEYINTLLNKFEYTDEPDENTFVFFKNRK